MVLTSSASSTKFTFTVLNSPVVNAFALPGGYVYVTRGLMALANSEAELASVIAHEIGHTLGLPHNNDPTSLMCGPCRTNELSIDHPQYMHLTETDTQILRKRYPSR